jgi:hypothetical protein
MTDTEHTLFQEVQADIERQKLEAFWKQYGVLVIIAAIAVVLATAGVTAYRSWHLSRNEHLTAELLTAGKPPTGKPRSIEALQKFVDANPGTQQADFALLQAGAAAVDQDDKPKAISFFDAVAQDATADRAFRQLGDLLSVQLQLDSGDAEKLSERLQPLTEELQPWRYSALEAQGYLALRGNNTAKARQIFSDLSQDARTPPSIAARASDILRSLN